MEGGLIYGAVAKSDSPPKLISRNIVCPLRYCDTTLLDTKCHNGWQIQMNIMKSHGFREFGVLAEFWRNILYSTTPSLFSNCSKGLLVYKVFGNTSMLYLCSIQIWCKTQLGYEKSFVIFLFCRTALMNCTYGIIHFKNVPWFMYLVIIWILTNYPVANFLRNLYNIRHSSPQWPLLLTWFNFNPSMDK